MPFRLIVATALLFTASAAAQSQLEIEVLAELNKVRASPRSLLPHLDKLRAKFNEAGKIKLSPTMVLNTQEGASAVEELIRYLKKAKKVTKLSHAPLLASTARDHQRDQQKTGGLGHSGSNGSQPDTRLKKRAVFQGKFGEAIAYGSAGGYAGPTGIDMVTGLLVDDGVPDRGHRTTLMDPAYKVVGIACGPHPKFQLMCVLDFATSVRPKKQSSESRPPTRRGS